MRYPAFRLAWAAALLLALPSQAQDSPAAAASSTEAPAADSAPAAPRPPLKVLSVQPETASVGDHIRIRFENLSTAGTDSDLRKLSLYLDGFPMAILPEVVRENELGFHLQRTDASAGAWSALLGKASSRGHSAVVAIGYPDQREIGQPNGVAPIHLRLEAYGRRDLYFGAGGVLLMVIAFVFMARTTGIIRDRGTDSVPPIERPYSLARLQMAVWFFVIFASVVYIRMVLGDVSLSDQALMLLGIGTATQLGGTMVEQARSPQNAAPKEARTTNLFTDLLTDDDGVSFHRFQMLAWTLALAIIFVVQVYDSLTMPEFPPSLLALMGISSGTYVTFKLYERQGGAAAAAPGQAAPPVQAPAGEDTGVQRVNVGVGTQIVTTARWESDGEILISGANFTAGTLVTVNGTTKSADAVTLVDGQHLRVRVAPGEAEPAEVVNVNVRNEDGSAYDVQLT